MPPAKAGSTTSSAGPSVPWLLLFLSLLTHGDEEGADTSCLPTKIFLPFRCAFKKLVVTKSLQTAGGEPVRGVGQRRDEAYGRAGEAAGGQDSRQHGVQPVRGSADGQHGEGDIRRVPSLVFSPPPPNPLSLSLSPSETCVCACVSKLFEMKPPSHKRAWRAAAAPHVQEMEAGTMRKSPVGRS